MFFYPFIMNINARKEMILKFFLGRIWCMNADKGHWFVFWTPHRNFGFHIRRETSWLAERLPDYQEGLYYTEIHLYQSGRQYISTFLTRLSVICKLADSFPQLLNLFMSPWNVYIKGVLSFCENGPKGAQVPTVMPDRLIAHKFTSDLHCLLKRKPTVEERWNSLFGPWYHGLTAVNPLVHLCTGCTQYLPLFMSLTRIRSAYSGSGWNV
jgi:hypothetical protein